MLEMTEQNSQQDTQINQENGAEVLILVSLIVQILIRV